MEIDVAIQFGVAALSATLINIKSELCNALGALIIIGAMLYFL
jgi:hypothetical protein